jgi:ABC-type glycerol-3-phosphate transport system substrate-binding protein
MLSLANDKGWTWFDPVGQYMRNKYGHGFQSQPYSDSQTYRAVIRSAAMTAKAPPIFTWWGSYQIRDLVDAGAIADLTPQMQRWISDYKVNLSVVDTFKVNGRYYGAPLYLSYWVIFYNKNVFKRYGLVPPATWQQFMELCDQLKHHGVAPLVQFAQPEWTGFIWFENLVANTNPQLYQRLIEGKASYTDPEVVKVMQLWKSLADKGYFETPPPSNNTPPINFIQGKTAMLLMGQWYQPTLVQNGMKSGQDLGAFIMPAITPGLPPQVIFETSPIVIDAHTRYRDQAIATLESWMHPDVQQQWVNLADFISAEAIVSTNDPVVKQIQQQVTTQHVGLFNRYYEATPVPIAVQVSSALAQFILQPDSYMQVLHNCESIASQYWSTQPDDVGHALG